MNYRDVGGGVYRGKFSTSVYFCKLECGYVNLKERCIANYKKGRMNGVENEKIHGKFPQDGKTDWVKGEARSDGYVYGVKRDGKYEFEVHYLPGPKDLEYMAMQDSFYLKSLTKTGLFKKEKLREKEPKVWYLWETDKVTGKAQGKKIGDWWCEYYCNQDNVGDYLAGAEKAYYLTNLLKEGTLQQKELEVWCLWEGDKAKGIIQGNNIGDWWCQYYCNKPDVGEKLAGAKRAYEQIMAQKEEEARQEAERQRLLREKQEQEEKANKYYADALAAAMADEYKEAISNYKLAKDSYNSLSKQGVDCTKRLNKIKTKMKEVQDEMKRSKASSSSSPDHTPSPSDFGAGISGGRRSAEGDPNEQKREDLGWDTSYDIPSSDLEFKVQIGKGGFGVVYQGKWRKNTKVAIKQLNTGMMGEKEIRMFRKEALIMGKLHHPNIVQLFGICTAPNQYYMVMEFMANKSLHDVLKKDEQHTLPWNVRWKIAEHIGKGMQYLHKAKPVILHRDLKSQNVLLDAGMNAKLTDFGLSTIKQDTQSSTRRGFGTLKWMAPEQFDNKENTTKTDVYSYGITLWEIATRQAPYPNMSEAQVIGKVCLEGRPKEPKDCPSSYLYLMKRCWAQDSEERPTMDQSIDYLHKYKKEIEGHTSQLGSGVHEKPSPSSSSSNSSLKSGPGFERDLAGSATGTLNGVGLFGASSGPEKDKDGTPTPSGPNFRR